MSPRPEFRPRLDERSGVPYYRQVVDQVLLGTADGRLSPGDRLPTVRSLAVELAVNPNTIAKAYRELELLGVIDTQQGSGTFVASKRPREPENERRRALARFCDEVAASTARLGFSLDDVIDELADRRRSSASGRGHRAADEDDDGGGGRGARRRA
jgi:GntR family transcriptional regulator